VVIDVKAFNALPEHYRQEMGKDPFFTAFTSALLSVLELADVPNKINLTCDCGIVARRAFTLALLRNR